MLLSAEQLFSDSQALTGTAVSTNVIDLGATGTVIGAPAALVRDIGKGNPIPIIVSLDVAAGGTSPTITVEVQIDDNEAFASATQVAASETKSGGAAGDSIYLDVYLPEGTNERYLRLNYTLAGTAPTYTVTAGVVLGKQSNVVPGA